MSRRTPKPQRPVTRPVAVEPRAVLAKAPSMSAGDGPETPPLAVLSLDGTGRHRAINFQAEMR